MPARAIAFRHAGTTYELLVWSSEDAAELASAAFEEMRGAIEPAR